MPGLIRWIGSVDNDKLSKISEEIDKELAGRSPRQSLPEMLITSGGGSVTSGMAFYDQYVDKIDTIVCGNASSMAVVIFLTGKQRFITPSSYMFLHPVRPGFGGRILKESKAYHDISVLCNKLYVNVIAERTELTKKEVQQMMDDCKIVEPKEAVEFGFAHEIVTL